MIDYHDFIKSLSNHPALKGVQDFGYSYVLESPLPSSSDTEVIIKIHFKPFFFLIGNNSYKETTVSKAVKLTNKEIHPLEEQSWNDFLQKLAGKTYEITLNPDETWNFSDLFTSLAAAFKGNQAFKHLIKLFLNKDFKGKILPETYLSPDSPSQTYSILRIQDTFGKFPGLFLECDAVKGNKAIIRGFHFERLYAALEEILKKESLAKVTSAWDDF